MKKSSILLSLILLVSVLTSCDKNVPEPINNYNTVKLLEGSNVIVTTSDTTFLIAFNLDHEYKVKGSGLTVQNISHNESTVSINGVVKTLNQNEKWRN